MPYGSQLPIRRIAGRICITPMASAWSACRPTP